MTNPELTAIYRKSEDIVAREIEGELIIIPLVAGMGNMENELYALDETGREIWNRIDGQRSINKIIDELEELYDTDRETIQRDVLGFLKEIVSRNIINSVHGQ
jgi:coenzyme PQQ biosynthesis protein PqqD